MTKKEHPDWVLAHKRKGTEIRCLKGRYYLYEAKGFWDKTLKKSRKKTGSLLGRITPTGFTPSKPRISSASARQISVLEAGLSEYIHEENSNMLSVLQQHFGTQGIMLFLLAMFRLAYQSPLKNMGFYYDNSYIKVLLPDIDLSKNRLSSLLKEIGANREQISACLRALMGDVSCVLVDQTHVLSLSEQMGCNRLGYNSQQEFSPQVNLLFLFSPERKTPLYYRMLAGDIRETTALKNTLIESQLQSAIVIGDRGFYSKNNRDNLRQVGLDYILPLRRNHSLCDYTCLQQGSKESFEGFFLYEDRVIWYKSYQKDGQDLILFLDERLKNEEQKDYLSRIKKDEMPLIESTPIDENSCHKTPQNTDTALEQVDSVSKTDVNDSKNTQKENVTENSTEINNDLCDNKKHKDETANENDKNNDNENNEKAKGYTLERFYQKQHTMGTLTIVHELVKKENPEKIFSYFKSRNDIEGVFDVYKNILEADRSYMQGQSQMEAWSFINFLALTMYYRLYRQLVIKKAINKTTPHDIILFLQHIKKIKVNGKWMDAEITKKTQNAINLLRISGS